MRVLFQLMALILDLASWVYPLALLIGSSFLTTLIISRFSGLARKSTLEILAIFPLFYILWIFTFLLLATLCTSLLFASFKKPPKVTVDLQEATLDNFLSSLMICRILTLYRMSAIIRGLPLLNYPQLSPVLLRWINKLVLRTYSPSINIGKKASVVSRPQDPDLTHIGNYVVIGSECSLVAHSITTSPSGQLIFSSAPIEISDYAVIGGGSYIAPGVKVGRGAVIQMRSYLPAFTRIGPQEVWGGNPAVFQRMVGSTERSAEETKWDDQDSVAKPLVEPQLQRFSTPNRSEAEFTIKVSSQVASSPNVQTLYHKNSSQPAKPQVDELDTIVNGIIAKAIHIKPEDITDALTSDNCMSWDSMAQMSMASAIYDRFGIEIAPEDIFQLNSRQAVRQAISVTSVEAQGSPLVSKSASLSLQETSVPLEESLTKQEFALPTNPELLPLFEVEAVTQALAKHEIPVLNHPVKRVLFVSTFTPQPLKSPFELWCRAFQLPVEANFLEFDQIEQTLLAQPSEFTANSTGLNVVLTRPEDLISDRDRSGMVRGEQLIQAIRTFAKRQPGLVVSNLPPVVSVFFSASRLEVEQLRAWWQSQLEQIEGIQILDFANVVEEVGRQAGRDSSMEVVARAPYSQLVYQHLGIAMARLIRKTFLPTKKVLALDCDNTLWGGVVGEDGVDGLALSDDYPGRSFRLFQRSLLEYRQRGILLVLVSKNEESDVWQVFDQHPEMLIRRSDVAGYRINWQSKSENLRSLAKELNLGLDSFVFIDDSPTERLEVEANSPEVTVVPMPTDATQYVETLSKLWCFDAASLTDEDKKRTEYMRQEQERQDLQQQASNLESYLESLQLVVDLGFANDRDLPRVAQLTQKTNQFNLSLVRRSLNEIKQLQQTHEIVVMNVADRFGDYGLVGLAILVPESSNLVLDTFLMSCRVLGRGVEDAFVSALAGFASRQGLAYLSAPYQLGPRNGQIKDFLIRNGFIEKDSNIFSADVLQMNSAPTHIKINSDLIKS